MQLTCLFCKKPAVPGETLYVEGNRYRDHRPVAADGDLLLCMHCGEWQALEVRAAGAVLRKPTHEEYERTLKNEALVRVRAAWQLAKQQEISFRNEWRYFLDELLPTMRHPMPIAEVVDRDALAMLCFYSGARAMFEMLDRVLKDPKASVDHKKVVVTMARREVAIFFEQLDGKRDRFGFEIR